MVKVVGAATVAALLVAACGSSSHSSAGTTVAGTNSTVASTAAGGGAASTAGGTQPGVTASTITVGNVSSLTGPIPGIFQGAPFGVQAYFDYINSQGGVDGRQLKVRSQDDGFGCDLSTSATQASVNSVFAYVGDFSIYDNCQANVLAAHPAVPRVAEADSSQAKALADTFSAQPHSRWAPRPARSPISPRSTRVPSPKSAPSTGTPGRRSPTGTPSARP